MTTQTTVYREIIDKLPADSTLTLTNVSWEEYEAMLASVPEASALRITYERGTLQITTLSSEHESYSRLVERLIQCVSSKLRIIVLSFGSSTMRKRQLGKGSEPDACFYIQTAAAVGNKMNLDFGTDPPPDIVVEIDLHHDSLSKFPTYAALGVPEIWRYDGRTLLMYHLQQERYEVAASSRALPLLTSAVLTDFLNRTHHMNQSEILFAFEDWLDTHR